MGVQPGRCRRASTAARDQSTDTPADLGDHCRRRWTRRCRAATRSSISGTASDAAAAWSPASKSRSTAAPPGCRPPASTTWSYAWTATGNGPVTILSRAVDDSGNVADPAGLAPRQRDAHLPVRHLDRRRRRPPSGVDNDPSAVELGVRFQADADGVHHRHPLLQGRRQHRHARRQPVDRKRDQARPRRPFANETADRLAEVEFATPVAIDAGVTYVASYFAPNGHYALDRLTDTPQPRPGLVTSVHNAPLLRARQWWQVFRADTPGFPTQSFGASNYWVDVLFVPNSSSTLFVSARSPVHGAVGVSPFTTVTARFSADLDVSSITTTSFRLQSASGAVPAAVTYDPGDADAGARSDVSGSPTAPSTPRRCRAAPGACAARPG